jgi:hypothetical protein
MSGIASQEGCFGRKTANIPAGGAFRRFVNLPVRNIMNNGGQ